MGIHDMLQWWNLIYVAPLLISVVWILTTVFSGMHGHTGHGAGHGIAHHVGEVGHHIGHTVGHAIHHGDVAHGHVAHTGAAHTHTGNGSHHGHDAHSHDSRESMGSKWLAVALGIRQVPITLLIGIFLLSWGSFGLVVNRFFGFLRYPPLYIWPSLITTFFVSSFVTRVMMTIFGRLLPNEETYGVSRFELVGSLGKAVFITSETGGTVDIADKYGTVHRVQAKVEPGQGEIPRGAAVIVVDFDEDDKRFLVREGSV